MGHKTETHRHRIQCSGYQREGAVEFARGKGDQIYGDKGDLTLGGEHAVQYTGCILHTTCIETYT